MAMAMALFVDVSMTCLGTKNFTLLGTEKRGVAMERHLPHAKEAENEKLDWVKHRERFELEGALAEQVMMGSMMIRRISSLEELPFFYRLDHTSPTPRRRSVKQHQQSVRILQLHARAQSQAAMKFSLAPCAAGVPTTFLATDS